MANRSTRGVRAVKKEEDVPQLSEDKGAPPGPEQPHPAEDDGDVTLRMLDSGSLLTSRCGGFIEDLAGKLATDDGHDGGDDEQSNKHGLARPFICSAVRLTQRGCRKAKRVRDPLEIDMKEPFAIKPEKRASLDKPRASKRTRAGVTDDDGAESLSQPVVSTTRVTSILGTIHHAVCMAIISTPSSLQDRKSRGGVDDDTAAESDGRGTFDRAVQHPIQSVSPRACNVAS